MKSSKSELGLTNVSNVYLCKIPTVIIEIIIM